ncbi:hypothetical protein CRG98_043834 [Punica granatum]|uniref:Uncharacterized protein n=1 Tax=Punica granatum TaxID=22663 RepID=A0A2I0HVR6_PUNGR|nr:hypothetical protein CRG98_043834 [Punica granatum]
MGYKFTRFAILGGFGSYLLGLSQRVAVQSKDPGSNDFKNPSLPWIAGFLLLVSFHGLLSTIPPRKAKEEEEEERAAFRVIGRFRKEVPAVLPRSLKEANEEKMVAFRAIGRSRKEANEDEEEARASFFGV